MPLFPDPGKYEEMRRRYRRNPFLIWAWTFAFILMLPLMALAAVVAVASRRRPG